jgi:hypothetical protein
MSNAQSPMIKSGRELNTKVMKEAKRLDKVAGANLLAECNR